MLDHNRIERLLQTPIYDIRTAMWFSTTDTNAQLAQNWVPNSNNGYWLTNAGGNIEHDELTQMPTSPGSQSVVASPYSTRLRPMTDTSYLTTASKVVVTKIHFRAYDHRLTGSPDQDGPTNADIDTSLCTNQSFVVSRFRDGLISDWSHNWFRPAFVIGGVNLLRDLALPSVGTRDEFGNLLSFNVADMSVGIPCPWEFNDMYAVISSNGGNQVMQSPQVFAQVVQYIPTTAKYVRYPVKCIAEFAVAQGDR
jgi:hypothetical protein